MQWVNSEWSCYWCNRRIASGKVFENEPNQRTKEHVVPISKGGSNKATNIVPACKSCNSRRGNDMNWTPYAIHRNREGFMAPSQAAAMRAGGVVIV